MAQANAARTWQWIVGALSVSMFIGAPARAADPPAREKFNLDFIPNESQLVLALRPNELAAMKHLAGVKATLEMAGLFKPLDIGLDEIAEFKAAYVGPFPPLDPQTYWGTMVIRATRPHDWAKAAANLIGPGEKTVEAGQEFFRVPNARAGKLSAYWFPDDRTIVMAQADHITKTFTLRGDEGGPAWSKQFAEVAGEAGVFVLQRPLFEFFVSAGMANPAPTALVQGDDIALFALRDTPQGAMLRGRLKLDSPEAAHEVEQRVKQAFAGYKEQYKKFNFRPDAGALAITSIFEQMMDGTKLEVRDSALYSETVGHVRGG